MEGQNTWMTTGHMRSLEQFFDNGVFLIKMSWKQPCMCFLVNFASSNQNNNKFGHPIRTPNVQIDPSMPCSEVKAVFFILLTKYFKPKYKF